VHIDANDVFWMRRVEHNAVTTDFDSARARLRVSGMKVFDDHDIANSVTYGLGLPGGLGFPFPPIPPVFPVQAVVSFDVDWSGVIAETQIENPAQRFKGTFLQTPATIQWSAEQPGFRFQSEAPDPSRNLISVFGREKNGVFF